MKSRKAGDRGTLNQVFPILPMGKPRMTRRDKWKKRPAVLRYRAFKDLVKIYAVNVDANSYYHVVFVLPVPRSISKIETNRRLYGPHQQTPDKDNLEKALLDALFTNDAACWDGRASKVWGKEGAIILSTKNIDLRPDNLRLLLEKDDE